VAATTQTQRAGDAAVRELAREVSTLQAALLEKLHRQLSDDGGGETFAVAARELAEAFGSVSATALGALAERPVGREEVEGLHRSTQMRRRLDQLLEMHRRYAHPFGVVVIDIEGPGTRDAAVEEGGGRETALAVLDAAVRDSVRLVDETFRLEGDGICVLAPNQTTLGGVQMAERLLRMLDDLEAAGGLSIGISAGVVACPEHGDDAEGLLREADEAMWRARSVGQPVGVGPLRAVQDR
jgi:diguanylate cyclase (GGDEF)-like protein